MIIIRDILERLQEMRRLRESSVSVSINSKSYDIPYEVTKGKSITVGIAPIQGVNYFELGALIGSALSQIYHGIRRTPNNHHDDYREWNFNYSYTKKK